MKVLVSGANGYIGKAIARQLITRGHDVVGLVRSEAGRQSLDALAIPSVKGDLNDAASLAAAAADVDAVIETASADHADSTRAFLDALRGTDKTYIRTSGTGIYLDHATGEFNPVMHTEDDGFTPIKELQHRFAIDQTVLEAASSLRTIIIRPSMIYGYGASEQLPVLLRAAWRHQLSGWSGEGANRYGNVYLDDLAVAYQLALEQAEGGSVYNIAADEDDFKTIGEAIGTLVGVPARPFKDRAEGDATLGVIWTSGFASNSRTDSTKARTELGWEPVGPGLIDELTSGSYHHVWAAKEVTVQTEG